MREWLIEQAPSPLASMMMKKDCVGRPMEILLIEDSLVFAQITIEALKQGAIRHRLTLVVDGQEAMDFLQRVGRFARAPRPDLVLLDLGLPKKDGREVLAEIKEDAVLREIPVVVVTSSDDEADMQRSRLLGVDGYMTKPVDLEQFLGLIRDLRHAWHSDIALPAL
jgi:CheY-like chemotaxis protein